MRFASFAVHIVSSYACTSVSEAAYGSLLGLRYSWGPAFARPHVFTTAKCAIPSRPTEVEALTSKVFVASVSFFPRVTSDHNRIDIQHALSILCRSTNNRFLSPPKSSCVSIGPPLFFIAALSARIKPPAHSPCPWKRPTCVDENVRNPRSRPGLASTRRRRTSASPRHSHSSPEHRYGYVSAVHEALRVGKNMYFG